MHECCPEAISCRLAHCPPHRTSIGPRGDLVGYLRPETAQVGVQRGAGWAAAVVAVDCPHHHAKRSCSSEGPCSALQSFTLLACLPLPPQGIFVNFKDLLYYNGSKLPFAAAQVRFFRVAVVLLSLAATQLTAMNKFISTCCCAPPPPYHRSAAATVMRSRRARACCVCASSRRQRLSTLSTLPTRWGAWLGLVCCHAC